MKSNATEQQTIREYLLGQLPSEQQSQFEARLLSDDDVFEELEIVEDELVDEYLHAQLTDEDRQSFESYFMASPEHREKLTFARAFRKSLTNKVGLTTQAPAPELADPQVGEDSRTEEPAVREPDRKKSWFEFLGIQNPTLGYATAAALIIIVVGISWVVWKRNSAPRDPGRVLSVVLTSGLTRDVSEGPRKIPVTADTDTLRLQLIIPESPYSSYEATLVDAAGVELTTKSNLTKETLDDQRVVIFDVPANLVPPGDYRVKLNGATVDGNTTPFASYSFRVLN